MPDHLHRCSAHGPWPTEHPCTQAAAHLHYPAWFTLPLPNSRDFGLALAVLDGWSQRRPRRDAA